ncbi:AraC family transcriptional regulator [Govanella unica]|uniref:AraC family transcriptional regulator n=1 Tax=Govanella unica TaxID=2975056 RepID=A0A9X3TVR1_9PROT|nr:AraC family transcriptional regulator [Govania unica]MDA5192563.1 AraC family transcriptional regulator [Govania unica]
MTIMQFLTKARFRSSEFGLVTCGAPWSGRVPLMPSAVLVVIREGACWLAVDGQAPLRVMAGDVALIPRGTSHRLCSSLDVRDESVMEVIRKRPIQTYMIRHGGDGARTVFCAAVARWDDVAEATVARILPDLILVRQAEFGDGAEVASLAELWEREARKARETSPLISHRVLNLLLAEILFAKFADPALRRALMKGFAKPPVARALMLIHTALATDWTVSDLAKRVGLSRSAFTREFSALMGLAPGQYLTDHKLAAAASLLAATPYDLATVADLVGYVSVPSFIKAFKRRYRMPPGQYRDAGSVNRDQARPA